MFNYIFSGSRCLCFIETSHQRVSYRQKKLRKFSFLGCFSKRKTEECKQKRLNKTDQFSITTIFCSGLAESCNFIKKEPLAQMFSCEFCEISTNTSWRLLLWFPCFCFLNVHYQIRKLIRNVIFICEMYAFKWMRS